MQQLLQLQHVSKEQFIGINISQKTSIKDTKLIFTLLQRSYKRYFLPNVKIESYNVMIDHKNVFNHPLKNDLRTCESIAKIATGQGDD